MYMSQLNIHLTPQFENMIALFMRKRGIATKSEAIRVALREALERSKRPKTVDFLTWLGAAKKAPLASRPRFRSDADIWK